MTNTLTFSNCEYSIPHTDATVKLYNYSSLIIAALESAFSVI